MGAHEALGFVSFIILVEKTKPALREFTAVLCEVQYQHYTMTIQRCAETIPAPNTCKDPLSAHFTKELTLVLLGKSLHAGLPTVTSHPKSYRR